MKDAKKRDVDKMLKAAGFEVIRKDGRHEVWGHQDGRTIAVPRHSMISAGVMRKIHKVIDN